MFFFFIDISIQLPGGLTQDGKINLKNIGFFIDQEKFARYSSSKQNSVQTESLMKLYFDTLVNLTSIHSRDLPNFPYHSYKSWAFINGCIIIQIQLTKYFSSLQDYSHRNFFELH